MRTALRSLAISSLLLALMLPAIARPRPHYGGTLRLELGEKNWLEDEDARLLVLDTMTRLEASGEVQPGLATQWEEQNGARRWRLRLRRGVLWHDGTPLNADSVAASLRALIPGSLLEGCSVRAEGETVVLESQRPIAKLPTILALPYFAIMRMEDGKPLGTGSFQLARVAENRAELVANESCWHGRPFLDGITIISGRSSRQQWMDAAVEGADVAAIPAELLRRAQQERLKPVSSGNSELIALQATARGLTLDVRLRQALAATVDRAVLLSFAFQKQGEVAAGILPNWMTGYATLLPGTPDAVRARELRSAAGQSRPLMIGYPADDATLQIVAERIALNAREAGIQAQTTSATAADFTVRRIALPSLDPQVALQAMAALVQTDAAIASGEEEDLFRAERELLMQANLIPLLHVPRAFAIAERVRGAVVDESGALQLGGAWIKERR